MLKSSELIFTKVIDNYSLDTPMINAFYSKLEAGLMSGGHVTTFQQSDSAIPLFTNSDTTC